MSNKIAILRSTTATSRPTGTTAADFGRLYWNDADQILGVITAAGVPRDLTFPLPKNRDTSYALTLKTGATSLSLTQIDSLRGYDSLTLNISKSGMPVPNDPIGDTTGSGDAFDGLNSAFKWCENNLATVGILEFVIGAGTFTENIAYAIPRSTKRTTLKGSGQGSTILALSQTLLMGPDTVQFDGITIRSSVAKCLLTGGRTMVVGNGLEIIRPAAANISAMICQGLYLGNNTNLKITGRMSGTTGALLDLGSAFEFSIRPHSTITVDNSASGTTAIRVGPCNTAITTTASIIATGAGNNIDMVGTSVNSLSIGAVTGTLRQTQGGGSIATRPEAGINQNIQTPGGEVPLELQTTGGTYQNFTTGSNLCSIMRTPDSSLGICGSDSGGALDWKHALRFSDRGQAWYLGRGSASDAGNPALHIRTGVSARKYKTKFKDVTVPDAFWDITMQSYEWLEDSPVSPGEKSAGLIADDVDESGFKDAVFYGIDDEVEGLKDSALIGALHNEIKKLRERVAALEAKP